jgi:DNA-binding Lrp family transcriptional regulator
VDEVDLAILRELGREQAAGVGNLDPRLSLNEVARRAELPPSTVSKRVRDWEESGLLAGRSTWPNPALFDANLVALSVHAPGLRERPRLVEDLGLVDGVLLVLEHVEPWLGVLMAHEDEPVLDRRLRLIERIAGVVEVGEVIDLDWPVDVDKVSDLQWRLIEELFEDPAADLHEIADRVGVSTRTVTRKLQPLVEGDALWSVFELDFRRWTGGCLVRLLASVEDEVDRSTVLDTVGTRFPDAVFINNSVHGPRVGPGDTLDLLVLLPAPARIPEAERSMEDVDGIAEAEVLLPRGIHAFDHWFQPRLREQVARATG